MNKKELREKLTENDIPDYLYSLDGNLMPDRMILKHIGDNYSVFYFDEKGNVNDQVDFESEDKACRYLLAQTKKILEFL